MPIGSSPYSTNVKKAPSTLPVLLVASATAIMRVTYSQVMITRYMSKGAKERKTLMNIALRQQVGNNGAETPCDRPTIEEAA